MCCFFVSCRCLCQAFSPKCPKTCKKDFASFFFLGEGPFFVFFFGWLATVARTDTKLKATKTKTKDKEKEALGCGDPKPSKTQTKPK